jgi:hypothetical protein
LQAAPEKQPQRLQVQEMTDRPIIFSAPMVRALLEGRKTQTRRMLKLDPKPVEYDGMWMWKEGIRWGAVTNPTYPPLRYAPGDRLYVREAHSLHNAHGQGRDDGKRWGPWGGLPTTTSPDGAQIAYYREGFDRSGHGKWRPSIHMPRWASRITLTVTEVRVQRLKDIIEADAKAEGASMRLECSGFRNQDPGWSMDWTRAEMGKLPYSDISLPDPQMAFANLWNSLHGPDAWGANPWVVAYTFTVQRGNIDALKPGT